MSAEVVPEGQVVQIPVAKFIEDVEQHLGGREPEEALKQLNQNYQIYKSVESQLLQKKTRMLSKIPDLKKAIEMVDLLIEKDGAEIKVDYSLSEQIHTTAKLKDVKHVKLWLGADIMLEYELEDAKRILGENLETTQQSSDKMTKDLELMKDYITVTEVSMARVYNYDVAEKRKKGKPSS